MTRFGWLVVVLLLCPATASGATVVGWGRNTQGALGAGFRGTASTPVPTKIGTVKQIALGSAGYALLENGTVDAWGDNTFGELGNGTHTNTSLPAPVPGVSGVIAIAASAAHAMALLTNGTVVTWGGNSYGQLGNGTGGGGREVGQDTPIHVPGLNGVAAVAAGGADDAALLSNGTVEAWGENKAGQLGDGTTSEKSVPTPVKGLTGVKAIALGGDPSIGGRLFAILENGTLMAVGGNGAGQLGSDSTAKISTTPVQVRGLEHVISVSTDISHSMALLENGTVYTWGDNAYGQLGVPTSEKCGADPCSRTPLPTGLTDVTSISAGFHFSTAVSDGEAFTWGAGQFGELGDESTLNRTLPGPVVGLSEVQSITAGESHALAIIDGPPPPPVISVTPGIDSLAVHWTLMEEPSKTWSIQWRPKGIHNKFSKTILLPSAARSYTITGLTEQPYEVLVRNASNFGTRIVVGTPAH